MKSKNPTSANETGTLTVRNHLSTFQEELATCISELACKDFQDINKLDKDLVKQFNHIVANYSWNLTHAMGRLAVKARMMS